MNRKLMAMPFLAIFGLMLLQMGSMETQTVEAATIEENEIAQFLTCYLDNVSAHIAPASAAMHASSDDLLNLEETGRVIHLSSVGITAGTVTYSKSAFVQMTGRDDSLHSMTEQQINQFINYKAYSPQASSSFSLLGATAALNDTSEAAGTNMLGEVDYDVEDMKGETNYNTNSSNYVTFPTVEPRYQAYAATLEKNSTLTQFEFDKSDQKILHLSHIANVENTMLSILEANIAANQSTTSDTITPDRVTILDYDFNMTDPRAAVMDLYLKESFTDRIRGAVSDYESSKASAQANHALVIFGFTIAEWKGPVRAYGRLEAPTYGTGELINIAQTGTIPILTIATPQDVVDSLEGIIMNTGNGVIATALSAPIQHTVVIPHEDCPITTTYTQNMTLEANQDGSCGKNGKLTPDSYSSWVGGYTFNPMSLLPYLLIGGGLLIAGAAIYFFLLRPRMKASDSGDVVPY